MHKKGRTLLIPPCLKELRKDVNNIVLFLNKEFYTEFSVTAYIIQIIAHKRQLQ